MDGAPPSALERKVSSLPLLPGIYVFKAKDGKVLYVGKSVSLKNRVQSYFQRMADHTPRIRRMVERVTDLEFFVTTNEEEALIMEYEFITRYSPRYNIVFRDDKSYPYLKVTEEDFPRILFTRRPREHAGEVLGPFPSALSLRRTLRFMTTVFPVRSCNVHSRKLPKLKACLDFHIKRCKAPCEGKIDKEAYGKIVQSAVAFLKGKDEELVKTLKTQMDQAAASWQFERAAEIKQRLEYFRRIHARQELSRGKSEDLDVLAAATDGSHTAIQLMCIRSGRIAGQDKARVRTDPGEVSQMMATYLTQHYMSRGDIPGEVLLSGPIADQDVIARVLSRKAGRTVELSIPQRGHKAHLVEMARKNAELHLSIQEQVDEEGQAAVQELAQALGLTRPPRVVECFDISHLHGRQTVASMVVARDGHMDRSSYRRFKIRTVEGIDDFASMREVVTRRYGRLRDEGKAMPDLVMLDGGLGQLSAGHEAMRALGLDLPLVALAKQHEILYAHGFMDGLALPEGSLAHRLVRRIRDEAHRFAITYHRSLRSKRALASELDEIPGVGPTLRKRLLVRFKTLDAVREAGIDGLREVPGLPFKTAELILKRLEASLKDRPDVPIMNEG